MWWPTGATKTKFKADVDYKPTGKKMVIEQPKTGNAWGIFFANINLDWIIENVFKTKVSIPFFSNLKACKLDEPSFRFYLIFPFQQPLLWVTLGVHWDYLNLWISKV